jgi:hypothetical protein
MNPGELLVKEIFALFGHAMYISQVNEKLLLSMILMDKVEKIGISKTRFDELLYENSKKTLGQLKREILKIDTFSENELKIIEAFHKDRDLLVHSYWHERSLDFYLEDRHPLILEELQKYNERFEKLHGLLLEKIDPFIQKYNFDVEFLENEIVAQGEIKPIEIFRELSKVETVIDIFSYRNSENSRIPIFEFEDGTFWTVCEIGLTQYKFEILIKNKERIVIFNEIFPIRQFNPHPKTSSKWNYILDLKKKNFKIKISKDGKNKPMKWKIINGRQQLL